MSKARAIALIYVGDGSIWRCPAGNVPRKDLTNEEAERYGGADYLASTPLYKRPPEPKKKKCEVNDGNQQ